MLKKFFAVFLFFFFGLHSAPHAGIENFGDSLDALGIKDVLPLTGIDIDRAAEYLNWEKLAVSLRADMESITRMKGKAVRVDSVIYKKGITAIRIDIKGGLQLQESSKDLSLADCYFLQYPLKDKALLVVPAKKGYVELDPEKIRELLGDRIGKNDQQKGTVQKKERLGSELVAGLLCDKLHIVQLSDKGIKSDITTWLAKDLFGFPVKTLLQFELPNGQTGASSLVFSNIRKGEQAGSLFELPGEFEKYDNLVELATEGRRGSRLGKPKDRKKIFKRQ